MADQNRKTEDESSDWNPDERLEASLDEEERQDTNLHGRDFKASQEAGLDTEIEHSPEDFSLVDLGQSGPNVPLDPRTIEDLYITRSDRDDIIDQLNDYTDDEDVLDDFADRQDLAAGRYDLLERLSEHNSKSPDLSGGDVDARWEDADVSGEESVGSTVPTPDQDVVDELGDAVGIHYDDDEELATFDKLQDRDLNRWEMDPASANDEDDALDLDEPIEDEW